MSNGLRNPAAIAAASEFAKSDTGKKTIKAGADALQLVLVVGGLFAAGSFAWKQYKKYRSNKYLTDNAAKRETQIAVLMYSSMFTLPRDLGWFSITIPDGTNEELLNQLARQDTDLSLVAKAYKIIFDKVLIKDVNSELSGTELHAFFNNLNADGSDVNTPAPDLIPYLKGEPVFVRKKNGDVATRKGVKQANGAWLITNDTRGTFSFGEEIGIIYDIKRYASGEIDYIIDQHYSVDSIYGFTVASHRDLLNKNPES